MKTAFLALVMVVGSLGASVIVVHPMKDVPRELVSFANEPHAEIRAQKELIELFLREGVRRRELTPEEVVEFKETSIEFQKKRAEDGSESVRFRLTGCSGVFTDKRGVVYFWRLPAPRFLDITSESRETVWIVLGQARIDLLEGLDKEEPNQPAQPTRGKAPRG